MSNLERAIKKAQFLLLDGPHEDGVEPRVSEYTRGIVEYIMDTEFFPENMDDSDAKREYLLNRIFGPEIGVYETLNLPIGVVILNTEDGGTETGKHELVASFAYVGGAYWFIESAIRSGKKHEWYAVINIATGKVIPT